MGGGSKSDAWLQICADILGKPMVSARVTRGGVPGRGHPCGGRDRRVLLPGGRGARDGQPGRAVRAGPGAAGRLPGELRALPGAVAAHEGLPEREAR